MKTNSYDYLVLMLSMLLSTGAAQAAIPSADAATYPWEKYVIDDNTPGVLNLSPAFVGNNQVPMMSWGETDKDIIYWAHRTLDGDGNCGPDEAWDCLSAVATGLVDGTISNLATETFINTHVIRWAFQPGTLIRGLSIERNDDMSYVNGYSYDLVDLYKFGGILVGAPSLVSDGLRFRMAFTARDNAGDCGADGLSLPDFTTVYRWSCSDVDAFIYDISMTTYSIFFDPEDYPVIAWNNKFTGDTRQRLYLAYPATRIGLGGGWTKEIIDGNDWSTTGTLAALSISADGLGFIGYMQPTFRACGEIYCFLDTSPNLKAAFQVIVLNTYLPAVVR